MVPHRGRRATVRVYSAVAAILVMFVFGYLSRHHDNPPGNTHKRSLVNTTSTHLQLSHTRHLLSHPGDEYHSDKLSDDDTSYCHNPLHPPMGYNDSCWYVRDHCSGKTPLINYLSLIMCDLSHVKPLAYVLLGAWLLYLISLLSTTADYFFVPPLSLLANKLRLPPSIAAITLLAIGSGAPDIFTAYAALDSGHISLVLGALFGASLFISTVVLGTIIVTTEVKNINKVNFFCDIAALLLVVALVIIVALDGKVVLYEAILFPIFYIIYIAVMLSLDCIKKLYKKRQVNWTRKDSVITPLLAGSVNSPNNHRDSLIEEIADSIGDGSTKPKRLKLEGLSWPRGRHVGVKVQWFCELPFSLLRWLSIPSCNQNGHWTKWHHYFAVTSPVPMALVLLVASKGWDGFSITVGKLPLLWLLIILGVLLSLSLFFLLSPSKPPHWAMQGVLGLAALVMSIAWLYIEANETVAVLEAYGLVFGIDTAILGLMVLAVGNSVGDWATNTAVSRDGHSEIGVASCFRSPLLNDVIGLSVALIAKIGFHQHGRPFPVPILKPSFEKVKLSWIFLGISLFSSAIIFSVFKFKPPKPYGVALIYLYIVFVVFGVLNEVGVMKITLN